jgi:glycosyltransferase involved in cell wall biosynthesis
MALISVIVPVYNVENYIGECIDSILAQTMSSFELILVDDGSKDASGRICDEYAELDSRIRVIHKENGGLSSARNRGLDEAKGDYICFVDSDDAVSADYLEKLYAAIKRDNTDIVVCDIDAPKLSTADMSVNSPISMPVLEAKRWLYDQTSREYVLMVVAWNKMYAKKLLDGIRYPEGRLHEDEFMIGRVLSRAKTVSFVPDKLYVYRDNTSGITSDTNRFNLRHFDVIDAYMERISGAMDDEEYEFAIATLKIALYKCARLYGEGKEHGAADFAATAGKRYREVFRKYKELLNLKQRMKYRLFLVMPDRFLSLYNP